METREVGNVSPEVSAIGLGCIGMSVGYKENATNTNALSDPARFARAIRGLARDAHRTLRDSPSPAALRALSRRTELLASALGDRRDGPHGFDTIDCGAFCREAEYNDPLESTARSVPVLG